MIEIRTQTPFFFVALIALAFASPIFADEADSRSHSFNLEKKNLALHGYDPVSYFKNNPQEGQASLAYQYAGINYRFATQENLKTFKASPDRYEPQFGGWCAYALLDGDLVDVNPERYKIIDGKLYLFYDGFWGNTLKRWNEKTNSTAEAELVETANRSWKSKSSK